MSHTKEQIMEQAQVFASGWSLVGGIFDQGYAMEDAEQSKAELAAMVGDVVKQRDELLSALEKFTDWNKRYPSSRIYSATAIRLIAAELDQIAKESEAAIAGAKGSAA